MNKAKHITLVGALQIGFSLMGVLAAIIVFVALVGGGLISQDELAIAVTSGIALGVAGLLMITSVPGLIGAIGLLKRKSWSRILLLIVSIFQLPILPIGTAIAGYTIWVLMQDETAVMLGDSDRFTGELTVGEIE